MSELAAKTIVLYREGNSDSLEFAQYYAAIHNIDDNRLIAVPCSSDEILADYATFQSEIETPLEAALVNEYTEYGISDIEVIVVGYGVPGGFYDDTDIISTQSRLSRLGHTFSKQTDNPLFARADYTAFSSTDAESVIIVSRIDAPTLAIAKGMVDKMKLATRQTRVNGKFFFDKDAVLSNEYDEYGIRDAYYSDLSDFETLTLPALNVTTSSTFHWDDQTDIPLFRLEDDSFMWAWQTDRAGYSFFKESKPTRFFLYNADTDGGGSMRSLAERRWTILAMSSGYIASAGAMSDPTTDGFLRPKPFFEALLSGASIGEAFVLSCPFLDWTIGLFGDPLIKPKFPFGTVASTAVTVDAGFELMKETLAEGLGFYTARKNNYTDIQSIIQNITDFDVKVDLFAPSISLTSLANRVERSFYPPASSLFTFASLQGNLEDYLTRKELVVSSYLAMIGKQYPAVSLTYEEGFWFIDNVLANSVSSYRTYHFELVAARDRSYTDVVVHSTTNSSYAGGEVLLELGQWEYEKEPNVFHAITSAGVSSSFSGRRIRYNSSEILTRGEVFYVKFRQIDNLNQTTAWIETVKAIGT